MKGGFMGCFLLRPDVAFGVFFCEADCCEPFNGVGAKVKGPFEV